jgi:hypothetical protein
MRNKSILCLFIGWIATSSLQGQELQARFTIISSKISSQVNKTTFQTLQNELTNFLNTRKWTNDAFQTNEKIQCNFLLTLDGDLGDNVFKGKLTVQAARPVYNTNYISPILNYIDDNFTFRYIEFQRIEFNENRIQGNDPLAANITAELVFYVDMILGLDYDSFSLRGGDPYFQKAWNIVNNAPENKDIIGWKSFESQRNRYWMAENFNNSRYALLHDAIYAYYRTGMDLFYENEDAGRTGLLNCLNFLNTINTENPNSMAIQTFFQGKSNELVKIFSRANTDMKTRAHDLLSKLDITNNAAYKELK